MQLLLSLLLMLKAAVIFCESEDYHQYLENPSVMRLQEYIQIDTSKDDNLGRAVEFWKKQAESIGLPINVYEPAGKPVVVITWKGLDPYLPSIMLNSHMDVVPAQEHEWTYPPYSAHMDENGNIYGRGMQDTKALSIQYLEAIRDLLQDGVCLLRTLHITLMPDEELGGERGMKAFMKTDEFKSLNIGFALDEGYASTNDTLFAFYQDKRPWQMEFTVFGKGGHGFSMPDNSASEKANRLISRVLEFRTQNIEIMKSREPLDFGKYISLNANMIRGSDAVNVIPSNVTIGVDMRLAADSYVPEINDMVISWMDEAGNDTEIYYIRREDVSEMTVLDDSNPYWVAMKNAVNDMGYDIVALVCPATTDMLPLRNIGIPAVGFAPNFNTIPRLHGKDEYLNVVPFLRGIEIFNNILQKLGNLLPIE